MICDGVKSFSFKIKLPLSCRHLLISNPLTIEPPRYKCPLCCPRLDSAVKAEEGQLTIECNRSVSELLLAQLIKNGVLPDVALKLADRSNPRSFTDAIRAADDEI